MLALAAAFLFALVFTLGGYSKQMKFYTQNYYRVICVSNSIDIFNSAVSRYLTDGGADNGKAVSDAYASFRDDVKELYSVRFGLGGDLRANVEDINGELANLSALMNTILGYDDVSQIEDLHTSELREHIDTVYDCVDLLLNSLVGDGLDKYNSFKGGVAFVQVLMVLCFIGIVAFIIYTGYFIKVRIAKPIQDTCDWVDMFKDGYSDMSDLKFNTGDEMEHLAEAFNTVKDNFAKANAMKSEYETLMQKIHNDEEHKKKFVQQLYDEKREKEAISTVAKHDGLTGLYNRRTFDGIVDDFMEKKPESAKGALFLIDMDNFKNVNDTLGHLAGDEALKTLAGIMRIVFTGAYLGRYGGDEFIAFVADYENEGTLERLASDLCVKMDRTFEQGGKSVNLSVSVGIATSDGAEDYSELYMKADKALYYSKENGRNQYKMASTL